MQYSSLFADTYLTSPTPDPPVLFPACPFRQFSFLDFTLRAPPLPDYSPRTIAIDRIDHGRGMRRVCYTCVLLHLQYSLFKYRGSTIFFISFSIFSNWQPCYVLMRVPLALNSPTLPFRAATFLFLSLDFTVASPRHGRRARPALLRSPFQVAQPAAFFEGVA